MTQKRRKTKSERTRRKEKIVSFVCLLVISVIWSIPLLYMVGSSFKSDLDLQLHPEKLFPSSWDEWTLKHYAGFLVRGGQVDNMPIWMLNSLWSTAASIVITVIFDLITAYALVFLKFKGRDSIIRFLFLWMAVPGVIGTAPGFVIFSQIRNALDLSSAGTYL